MPDTSAVLAELEAQHPWPQELLQKARPLTRTWHHDLAVSGERLWPVVMDTSRTNRALGLGKMEFAEVEGRLLGTAANLGVPQAWVEVPWEWIHERAMVGVRLYTAGFAHAVRAFYALEKVD